MKVHTPESINEDLKAWCDQHGPIGNAKLKKTDSRLHSAVMRIYGSAERCANTFGLPYKAAKTIMTREEVITRIKQRHQEGLPINPAAISRDERQLLYHGRKLFGNWQEAVAASGIDPKGSIVHRKITDSLLRKELTEWFKKYGPLKAGVMSKNSSWLYAVVKRRYGGIEAAAKAFDLPVTGRLSRWSPEKVINMIQRREREQKSLLQVDVVREDYKLYSAGNRYFGTWRQAVESSGFAYNSMGGKKVWSKALVEQELRKFYNYFGGMHSNILKKYDRSLFSAVYAHFGSIKKAAVQLGLPCVSHKSQFASLYYKETGQLISVTFELKQEFGKRLRRAREMKKLSQAGLGRLINASRRSVYLWETGSLLPVTKGVIKGLEKVLGFSTFKITLELSQAHKQEVDDFSIPSKKSISFEENLL